MDSEAEVVLKVHKPAEKRRVFRRTPYSGPYSLRGLLAAGGLERCPASSGSSAFFTVVSKSWNPTIIGGGGGGGGGARDTDVGGYP